MGLVWPGYVRLLTVVLLNLRLHSMGILYPMGFYIMAKPDSLATVNVLCPEALERPIEDFSWVVVVQRQLITRSQLQQIKNECVCCPDIWVRMHCSAPSPRKWTLDTLELHPTP